MSWISALAIFFIIWWTVLFAVLPIGFRSQQDDDDVTLGTTHSAPSGPHMKRAVLLTTVISLAVFGIYYFVTQTLGYGFNDLPHIVPELDMAGDGVGRS